MAPENQSVRLKCCAVLTYPTSTKGSLCFLILRCGNLKNTTEYYRIVLKFSWKSALITNENTKSLHIGSVIFLEISIDSPKESTVSCSFFFYKTWINIFQKPRSLQIGSAIFLEISTEHRKWLQIGFVFSCKSAVGTWSTPNHYKLVFQFSWKPAPSHRQSLQFGL